MYSNALNLRPLARVHLEPWDLCLNKVDEPYYTQKLHTGLAFLRGLQITRSGYIPNFKHLSQVVLKKKILKYISFLKPRPPPKGHFKPLDFHLNKLIRCILGLAVLRRCRLKQLLTPYDARRTLADCNSSS